MLDVNIRLKGQLTTPLEVGALPPIGSLIVHPKHGGLRVTDIVFDYNEKGRNFVTLMTITAEEHAALLKKAPNKQ